MFGGHSVGRAPTTEASVSAGQEEATMETKSYANPRDRHALTNAGFSARPAGSADASKNRTGRRGTERQRPGASSGVNGGPTTTNPLR